MFSGSGQKSALGAASMNVCPAGIDVWPWRARAGQRVAQAVGGARAHGRCVAVFSVIAATCVWRSRPPGTTQQPPGYHKALRYTLLHRVNKTYDFHSQAKKQRLYRNIFKL